MIIRFMFSVPKNNISRAKLAQLKTLNLAKFYFKEVFVFIFIWSTSCNVLTYTSFVFFCLFPLCSSSLMPCYRTNSQLTENDYETGFDYTCVSVGLYKRWCACLFDAQLLVRRFARMIRMKSALGDTEKVVISVPGGLFSILRISIDSENC